MDLNNIKSAHLPFPVAAKVAAGVIDGLHTDVAVLGFSNCVIVLVSQLPSVGSILHAVTASLSNNGHEGDLCRSFDDAESIAAQLSGSDDIPVEIKFLLGNPGSVSSASSLYQIIAIHIAQSKSKQNPDDSRPILLGIGLKLPREYRLPASDDASGNDSICNINAYKGTVDAIDQLVGQCRIW
ncbi:hypothetical protein H4217_006579 [Coemansia sp. RSA 1939]|nr:hypothetical protein H4217_006579 [Coemansia sp. RSA 1939]